MASNLENNSSKDIGIDEQRRYTGCVEEIKKLKRDGKFDEAKKLLLLCIDETESEAKMYNETPLLDAEYPWLKKMFDNIEFGVAPWYYEQLAIIYRKEKMYSKEVEILERYANQPKAPGAKPEKLKIRLLKAKELQAKNA